MAAPYEFYNFLTKFNNLLRCGQDAHLSIESQSGNIYLNLQLRLANLPAPQECYQQKPRRCTPSRQRRRARRAKARAEEAESNEKSPSNAMAEAAEHVAANLIKTSEVGTQSTSPALTTNEAAVQAAIIEKESVIKNCREENSTLVTKIHELVNESKVKDELVKTNIVQINSLDEENKSFGRKLRIYGDTIKELNKRLISLEEINKSLGGKLRIYGDTIKMMDKKLKATDSMRDEDG